MRHKLTKTEMKRGGKGNLKAVERRVQVEKYLTAGFSLTQMLAIKVDKKKLGNTKTLGDDIKIIKTRWLSQDMGWFNRARVARVETVSRLKAQVLRLNRTIINIQNDPEEDVRKLIYAESQLTAAISKLYEVESDMDPEFYLKKQFEEGMRNKDVIKVQTAS